VAGVTIVAQRFIIAPPIAIRSMCRSECSGRNRRSIRRSIERLVVGVPGGRLLADLDGARRNIDANHALLEPLHLGAGVDGGDRVGELALVDRRAQGDVEERALAQAPELVALDRERRLLHAGQLLVDRGPPRHPPPLRRRRRPDGDSDGAGQRDQDPGRVSGRRGHHAAQRDQDGPQEQTEQPDVGGVLPGHAEHVLEANQPLVRLHALGLARKLAPPLLARRRQLAEDRRHPLARSPEGLVHRGQSSTGGSSPN
jgi:hypothetical protein